MMDYTNIPTKLNLGCGKVSKEGYWNVDIKKLDGVDEAVDLFTFPWPWPDNTFDEVYASHLVEHIPHLVRKINPALSEYDRNYFKNVEGRIPEAFLEPVWDIDGFFVFFQEVYRVLKPEGKAVITVPYAKSTGAFQDPTHTRYINEVTFTYLQQNENNPNFDYDIKCNFLLSGIEYHLNPGWDKTDPMMFNLAINQYWNVVHEFVATLEKITSLDTKEVEDVIPEQHFVV